MAIIFKSFLLILLLLLVIIATDARKKKKYSSGSLESRGGGGGKVGGNKGKNVKDILDDSDDGSFDDDTATMSTSTSMEIPVSSSIVHSSLSILSTKSASSQSSNKMIASSSLLSSAAATPGLGKADQKDVKAKEKDKVKDGKIAGDVVADVDENPKCEFWAKAGECAKNPRYMLYKCSRACQLHGGDLDKKKLLNLTFDSSEVDIKSFYEIVEINSVGQTLNFSEFKGKVVYIVNSASHCGYSTENFELLRKLQKYSSQGLELVIAPCNQFGFLEPGDSVSIAKFAKSRGYKGHILMKMDVNGPLSRPSYSFLRNHTKTQFVEWNFHGKFLISREGRVFIPTSMELIEKEVQMLLNSDDDDEL